MKKLFSLLLCFAVGISLLSAQPYRGEKLSRGFVGIPTEKGFYMSWRMLLDDKEDMAFDVYRSTNGAKAIKINNKPITLTSDFLDTEADLTADNTWSLRSGGKELATWSRKGNEPQVPYLTIPLQVPEARTVFGSDEVYTYKANDSTVADLDGDGEYKQTENFGIIPASR